MTFDTFDTYNTDEAYKDKGTTAKGLVAAYKKDNPNGTKEDFYSKLNKTWAQDKDGHVKNAVEEAFKVDTPKEEEKVVETVKETAPEEIKTEAPKAKTDNLDKKTKDYMTKQDEINDIAENQALEGIEDRSAYNWEKQYETQKRAGEAFKSIDDKMIEQLPTFLYRRYQNGEFGDISDTSTPEGRESKKNAQLRLAHFVLNGVQSKLKNASNAAMIAAGRSPMFSDTMSDYEKYQQSNLAKGMENRWKKYEAETENAIQLASKESMTEQEARLEAEKIARDKKLSTKWNMMDARQKVDLMNIKREIGKLVGDMDLSEIADFMTGEAISGDLSKDEAIAIGVAQLVKKTPQLLAQLPEGKYRDAVINLFGGGDVTSIIASLGGSLGGSDDKNETPENPDSIIDEKKTNNKIKNPTGNLKGYKALDGNTYDFETFESKDGKEKLASLINNLDDRFYNGEINAETYRKYREPLYEETKKHRFINASTTDQALKDNVYKKLDDLNKETSDHKVTVNDYKARTAKILEMAKDAGMKDNEIESLKKNFFKESKIKYKGPSK